MFVLWPWDLALQEAFYELALVVCCALSILHAWGHDLYIWVVIHLLLRTYLEFREDSRLVTKGVACFPNNVLMYDNCLPLLSQELQYSFWPYIDILVVWRLGIPSFFRPVAVSFLSYLPHMSWALVAPAAGFIYHDLSTPKKFGFGKKSTEFFGTGPVFFWWEHAPLHVFWISCGFEFALWLSQRWQGFRSPIGISPYPKIHKGAQVLMVAFAVFLDQLRVQRYLYKWARRLNAPIITIFVVVALAAAITAVGYRKRQIFEKFVLSGDKDAGGTMEIKPVKDHIPIVMLMVWHTFLLLAFLAGCEDLSSPARWPSGAGKDANQYRTKLMTSHNVYVTLAVLFGNFVVVRFVYIKAFEENWGFLVMKEEQKSPEAEENEKKELHRRFMEGRKAAKAEKSANAEHD